MTLPPVVEVPKEIGKQIHCNCFIIILKYLIEKPKEKKKAFVIPMEKVIH